MAGILRRAALGVKRKGLQDVVVELRCGKVPRKMADRKWACARCVLESGGIYGKCRIQFRRGQAGDAEFGRVEIEIFANCDSGFDFHFAAGIDDVDSHGTRWSVNAFRKSDG